MIKYTFLLPAYKPDFLEVALRSIKSQTLKDFKIIDLCDVIYSDGKINVTEKTDDRNRMKIWLDLMGFKIKRYNIYKDIFGKMRGYFELEKC